MMLEGGKIDWAAHAHDAATVVTETIDFDQCIRLAYEFYKKHPDETLILVTADQMCIRDSCNTAVWAFGTLNLKLPSESVMAPF